LNNAATVKTPKLLTPKSIADVVTYAPSASLFNLTMTLSYYRRNARNFFDATIDVDMAPLYRQFLPRIPQGGHILDAGCGSGRDSKAFLAAGFQVTAFDASAELAALASQEIRKPVQTCRFQEFAAAICFDAIWACASLLHVPRKELPEVIARLAGHLKPQGIFYCSFKYGREEISRDGRHFTDLDETGLREIVNDAPLALMQCWQSGDQRPGREQELWLNALLRKV